MEDPKRGWDARRADIARKISRETPARLKDRPMSELRLAGADLSFIPGDDARACLAYVVMKAQAVPSTGRHDSDFEVVYEDVRMIELAAPYVPGYLAFREAAPIVEAVERQRSTAPDLLPDVLIVDGNGLLHPHRCGLACHVGVESGLPTLGAAKNLHVLDLESKEDAKSQRARVADHLRHHDRFDVVLDGEVAGCAIRTSDDARRPIYVSIGHMMSLDFGVDLVRFCSKYKVPEPTRQADIRSREYLRLQGYLK